MKVSKLVRMALATLLVFGLGLVDSLTAEPTPVMTEALTLIVPGERTALADGSVIYVDADASGANNGTSWADAFNDLQSALDVVEAEQEIWVAAGVYRPTLETDLGDPRSASFQMVNGVAIYGGFDPIVGDIGWEDRDWVSNETILSGDLGGNDGPDFASNEENSYHVFYHPAGTGLDATAVLDGFTITGGNADGDHPHSDGGGMYNHDSSPTLNNCAFAANWALTDGGGMWNYESSPMVTDSSFSGNWAGSNGGGMYSIGLWSAVTNCAFSGNYAGKSGGGMATNYSSAAVTGCLFSGNSAHYGGGGMLNIYSWPVVTDCTFTGNSAGFGGGMWNFGSSPSPAVANCTFSGNSASDSGGGMYNFAESSTEITNCTFFGNSAGASGGGMYNHHDSLPSVTNCILWEDTAGGLTNEISNDETSHPAVTYSDVQGGYDGVGNIDADPIFADPNSGGYHLGPDSPCIDAGNNSAPDLPEYDFEGDDRVLDGDGNGTAIVDMGVDEQQVYFVDADAAGGAHNGSSWGDAFTELQPALEAAGIGDQIWVAAGVYRPTLETDLGDLRSASFQMKNGVALYGGFDPSVGDVAFRDRDWVNHETILSGDLNGDDGPDFENNDDNSYHVFYHPDGTALDATAILDGFMITGGNADSAVPHNQGAGMHNYNGSSPTLTNCTFSGNSASFDGGGMFNIGGSSPSLTNCTFQDNSAAYEGGGMFNSGSSPSLTDCTFQDNSGTSEGGGMYNGSFSSPPLVNCAFAGNSSASGGGMYNAWSSSPSLTNCTFTGNSATYNGGGINNWNGSSPALTNCILWGDTAGGLPEEIYNYDVDSIPVVNYSDIQGGYDGTGNIDEDPRFVNADGGDYHLELGSPCIDAGNNDAPNLPAHDFEGDPRVLDGDGNVTAIVDMGVDEVSFDWPYFHVYLPVVLRGN